MPPKGKSKRVGGASTSAQLLETGLLASQLLEMNLSVLQKDIEGVLDILFVASHSALYELVQGKWERMRIEGTLFVVRRSLEPQYMLVVKNRLEIKDFTLALERGMNVDTNTATSMVMFRTVTPKTVYGVWFSDPEDCILFGSKLSSISAGEYLGATKVQSSKPPTPKTTGKASVVANKGKVVVQPPAEREGPPSTAKARKRRGKKVREVTQHGDTQSPVENGESNEDVEDMAVQSSPTDASNIIPIDLSSLWLSNHPVTASTASTPATTTIGSAAVNAATSSALELVSQTLPASPLETTTTTTTAPPAPPPAEADENTQTNPLLDSLRSMLQSNMPEAAQSKASPLPPTTPPAPPSIPLAGVPPLPPHLLPRQHAQFPPAIPHVHPVHHHHHHHHHPLFDRVGFRQRLRQLIEREDFLDFLYVVLGGRLPA